MPRVPAFVSVVYVVRNQSTSLARWLTDAVTRLDALASDFELIVIDNGSEDGSIDVLQRLTAEGGLPNIQVYALTQRVSWEVAAWAGTECALGDYVAILDPLTEDLSVLPEMLERATTGTDVVFARNRHRPRLTTAYRLANRAFSALSRWTNGVDPGTDAPPYRLLSKKVINFILQHPQPAAAYRLLPATAGFRKSHIDYSFTPESTPDKHLLDSVDRGIHLLLSNSRAPMRAVTALSLFGAVANMVYSLYVVAIAIFKDDVAPGWVSLSLQQSGMFFLLSMVLLVLGEYILQVAAKSSHGPAYHVAIEFTSAKLGRLERLNVEIAAANRNSTDHG